MINCVSAICCVSYQSSALLLLYASPVVWVFSSVFVSTASVKAYGMCRADESCLLTNLPITFYILFGTVSIVSTIFTISNLLQSIFGLITANYAMKLQKHGQLIFLIILAIMSLTELAFCLLVCPQVEDHLIESSIAISLLVPVTVLSYLYESLL